MDIQAIEEYLAQKKELNPHKAYVMQYLVNKLVDLCDTTSEIHTAPTEGTEVYRIGACLNSLGESDDDGWHYMQAAVHFLENEFGIQTHGLSTAWDKIGRWWA
ncbi:hypothetical protein [Halomonas sp. 15WGF]|jgi:hypothetical protein|uniref:hypothetical protein n=1 Tax=Halomonas sp. 15WGF TaxID=2570357 RepID=UPI0010BEAE9F|nr:hypothetical protein [Halomonas sp. 15WGF]MED5557924.1 hypothetical protein [Pseudomonadota bacterium]TKJ10238.1 hypothetical protein E8Q34_12445 [Halomonas sp. 15WGF]